MSKMSACFTIALILISTEAQAYIGPGLGAGAIGAVLGVIGSIFLLIFAVIYYPIKRMLKKKRGNAAAASDASEE
jgi:hypothetical protein